MEKNISSPAESVFDLKHYFYDLPESCIAQNPPAERGQSRLLVLDTKNKSLQDDKFKNIVDYLPENALLVANNSRVVPARVLGSRQSGAKTELLLMTPAPILEQKAIILDCVSNHSEKEGLQGKNKEKPVKKMAQAEVLLKGSKRIKPGEELDFAGLGVKVLEKYDFGKHFVELTWENSLIDVLEEIGSIPLPPYIKRPEGPSEDDVSRYQTIYADKEQSGSVAAPTAGLHFTEEIQKTLARKNIEWQEVTLHVGYGTFSPVHAEDIRDHDMHGEYVEIPPQTCEAILRAKAENRPIITVGTTATRCLEGMAKSFEDWKKGDIVNNFSLFGEESKTNTNILPILGCSGITNIFIYPEKESGKEFRVIDGMITNFHLPESTLLMLVSTLAGYDFIMQAYQHAIEKEYKFFSYGDAMLIK